MRKSSLFSFFILLIIELIVERGRLKCFATAVTEWPQLYRSQIRAHSVRVSSRRSVLRTTAIVI